MPVTVSHIDTCGSQYFQGCNLPYIQVPVTGATTLRDVVESLKDEIVSGYITNEAEIADVDSNVLKAAVDKMVEGRNLDAFFNAYLELPEEADDHADNIYAYFSFSK